MATANWKIVPQDYIREDGKVCGRTFIEADASEEKTQGGIIIPETAQQKATTGRVRYCSENSRFKEDARVLLSKYAGSEASVNGVTYRVVKDDDILAELK